MKSNCAKKIFLQVSAFLLFLASWQLISFFLRDLSLIFPSPLGVIKTLIKHLPLFVEHSAATALEMLWSLFLAVVLAFPLALLMTRFQLMKLLLQPFFITMQCIPMFTLAPIFIVCLGWSTFSVIIPTVLMILFPLSICLYKGLIATSKKHEEYFKIHGIRKLHFLTSIKLPFALSHIFSGLRIACGIAGVGVIGGEWAGAQKGLGVLMQISRRNFDLESVCASILCLLVLSLFYYGLVSLIELILTRKKYEKTSYSI